ASGQRGICRQVLVPVSYTVTGATGGRVGRSRSSASKNGRAASRRHASAVSLPNLSGPWVEPSALGPECRHGPSTRNSLSLFLSLGSSAWYVAIAPYMSSWSQIAATSIVGTVSGSVASSRSSAQPVQNTEHAGDSPILLQ